MAISRGCREGKQDGACRAVSVETLTRSEGSTMLAQVPAETLTGVTQEPLQSLHRSFQSSTHSLHKSQPAAVAYTPCGHQGALEHVCCRWRVQEWAWLSLQERGREHLAASPWRPSGS